MPKAAAPVKPEFLYIAISLIAESALNPRKAFDEGALTELAASIKEKGVLQPVVVRPIGASYELVAGARRFRASQMAGQAEIPAVVRDLDDKQVLEIMVIENAQRSDVHPLEEAEAFNSLIKLHGHTVETIAEKIGKPIPYVHQRLRLDDLSKQAKAEFSAHRILIGHALILCRLAAKAQDKLVESMLQDGSFWDGEKNVVVPTLIARWTVQELRRQVQTTVLLKVSAAPFDPEDADLVKKAGPCSLCQKRTGADAHLFGGELGDEDQCKDRTCYTAKVDAHIKATREKLEAEGETVYYIRSSWGESTAHGQRVIGGGQWVEAKENGPAYGIYVESTHRTPVGTVVRIKLAGIEEEAANPEQVAYEKKRKAWKEAVGATYRSLLADAITAAIPTELTPEVIRTLFLQTVQGYSTSKYLLTVGIESSHSSKEDEEKLREYVMTSSDADLLKMMILGPLQYELNPSYDLGSWKLEGTQKTADRWSVDHAALLKQAKEAAGPQPEKPGAKPKKEKKAKAAAE